MSKGGYQLGQSIICDYKLGTNNYTKQFKLIHGWCGRGSEFATIDLDSR